MVIHLRKMHGQAWRLVVVAFLANAFLQAARGDDVGAGSCDRPATGNCDEWTGPSWKALKTKRLCESQKGTFLPGSCPVEGRVGTCLRGKGKGDESRLIYYAAFPGYGAKFTLAAVAAQGEDQCTRLMKGVWIPTQP